MKNFEISQIFRDIADILEIKGENVFRIRAYQRAAQSIDGLSEDVENLLKEGRLTSIPGVGKDLSDRIKEYINTGKIRIYEDLKRAIPEGLLDILNIPSVGPKKAKLLYEKLNIRDIRDLEDAISNNRLQGVFGIREKTVENIKAGLAIMKRGRERLTLEEAAVISEGFLEALKKSPQVKRISPAGSLRRQKETVRDIDILITSTKPKAVMESFTGLPQVRTILAKGDTKSSVRTQENVQVDCRVVEEKSFGAALLYFTGSKDFNIRLRQIAIRKGLKLNEYGLYKGQKFICGRTEGEMFKALGLRYVEPELREDTGEIELAQKGKLPGLLDLEDIKGDLHAHSSWSDGLNSIEDMAFVARKLGYSYIAITDHSQSLKVANGLSLEDLKKKKSEINRINKKLKGLRVLYGTEVDIDSNGNIDYKDDILKRFDIVVAAIHTGFKQSRQQLTKRVVRACQNKFVHIIAHPTARLWGQREAYDIDLEEVFRAGKDTNTALEINAFANRLDLNDRNCRRAKELGVRMSIGTDSHMAGHLNSMRFGVAVARRGWLSPKDVINTLPLDRLLKEIKKR